MTLISVVVFGQSGAASLSSPSGGDVSTVKNVGTYEQFPKVGQTRGMKFVGPTSFDYPLKSPQPNEVVSGIGYTFCRLLRNRFPRDDIMFVQYAAGGQPIEKWLYGAFMMTNLLLTWEGALTSEYSKKWGPRSASYVIGVQGEANFKTPGEQWASKVNSVFESLTRNSLVPIVGPKTKLAFCESPANPPLNARNADMWRLTADNNVQIVSALGIPVHDGIHATAVGLEAIAQRCFTKLVGP